MSYTIKSQGNNEYWLEDEKGRPYPATFLSREAAEQCAILLNREDKAKIEAHQEPIRIVLSDTIKAPPPSDVLGYHAARGSKEKRVNITLEQQQPQPAPGRVKVVL